MSLAGSSRGDASELCRISFVVVCIFPLLNMASLNKSAAVCDQVPDGHNAIQDSFGTCPGEEFASTCKGQLAR